MQSPLVFHEALRVAELGQVWRSLSTAARGVVASGADVLGRYGPQIAAIGAVGAVGVSVYVWRRELVEITGSSIEWSGRAAFQSRTQLSSWLVDSCFSKDLGNRGVRKNFQQNLEVAEPHPSKNHSHPVAAAFRTLAEKAMTEWVRGMGLTVYNISSSSRDDHLRGYHQFHMAKDCVHRRKFDPVLDTDVIRMVDCDYYTDMAYWLSYGRPVVLYTFVPNTAGGRMDDGTFRIEKNRVLCQVDGGASYEHELWDYDTDWMVVDYWWGSLLCSVESVRVTRARRVVLITPERKIYGPLGWFYAGRRLRRRELSRKVGGEDIACVASRGPWGKGNMADLLSVALSGRPAITLPKDAMLAIWVRFKESTKPSVGDVERLITAVYAAGGMEKDDAPVHAALLFEVLKKGLPTEPSMLMATNSARTPRPESYIATGLPKDGYLVTEDGKASGRKLAEPLVTEPDVVPVDAWNNDLLCIVGRIDKVRNTTIPPPAYEQYAREFVSLLVPPLSRHRGVALTLDEVRDHQDRPLQRMRADKAWEWVTMHPDSTIKAFQKKESYGSVNDPRNISTVPIDQTLGLSGYSYAFKQDVMRKQHWYVPGLTPKQIAEKVHAFVADKDSISGTDFSRMDGTFSEWLCKHVTKPSYLAWVAPRGKVELAARLDAEVKASGRTKHGVKYRANGTTLSGSPLTTDKNSGGNAFVDFCAHRLDGLAPHEAMLLVGPKAGDDGLTCAKPALLERVANDLGMKLKIEPVTRGNSVKFLGRMFLDPWSTPESVQDPVRTAKKLHISFTNPSVPRDVALYWRAYGYLQLDPNAPLISAWCRRAILECQANIRASGKTVEEMLRRYERACGRDMPFFASQLRKLYEGDPVEVANNTWPGPGPDDMFAYYQVAKEFGTDPAELHTWEDVIDNSPSLDSLAGLVPTTVELKAPAIRERPTDLVVLADGRSTTNTTPLTSPSTSGRGTLNSRKDRNLRRAQKHHRRRPK